MQSAIKIWLSNNEVYGPVLFKRAAVMCCNVVMCCASLWNMLLVLNISKFVILCSFLFKDKISNKNLSQAVSWWIVIRDSWFWHSKAIGCRQRTEGDGKHGEQNLFQRSYTLRFQRKSMITAGHGPALDTTLDKGQRIFKSTDRPRSDNKLSVVRGLE